LSNLNPKINNIKILINGKTIGLATNVTYTLKPRNTEFNLTHLFFTTKSGFLLDLFESNKGFDIKITLLNKGILTIKDCRGYSYKPLLTSDDRTIGEEMSGFARKYEWDYEQEKETVVFS